MSALDLLHKLPLAINPHTTAGVNRTIQFDISQPAHVLIRNGACEVTEGSAEDPDLLLKMSDDDLISLLTGKLDGMAAMMTGRLKLQGDVSLATQLGRYFDASKLQ